MIEVEKKFILTEDQEKRLVDGAEFLGEKKIVDAYYDDSRYSLTTKDTWLRRRNGKFELKVPMNEIMERRVSDQYRELETDEEIAAFLGLPAGKILSETLREKGYAPFLVLTTTRRKYRKDGFGIDLDSADFGYNVAELECIIDDKSKVRETTQKIIDYAKTYGFGEGVVRGKVCEFLRRKKPGHFQALVEAKITLP